jgi:hypothetical protein
VAAIDFEPNVLNLKSKGEWVTVYIELPEGYNVEDIDVSSVSLLSDHEKVQAKPQPTQIGDYNKNGILDLMVKFDRSAVQKILSTGSQTMTITGDGSWFSFQGTDTIKVISP